MRNSTVVKEAPLGLRDYLAYAMPGGVVLAAIQWARFASFDLEPSAVEVSLLLGGSYLLGHLLGSMSGFVLNKLGPHPIAILVFGKTGGRLLRAYNASLSDEMVNRIKRAATVYDLTPSTSTNGGRHDLDDRVEALRLTAASAMRNSSDASDVAARSGMLEDCRNVALAGLLSTAILVAVGLLRLREDGYVTLAAAVGLLLGSLLFCYRFLHFRRQYYIVVLTAFVDQALGRGRERS